MIGKNFACIKIAGRASSACSPNFKALLEGLMQKQFQYFIIELTECTLMDSTFLGVLASFGLKLNPDGAVAGRGIELSNTNPRISELLESLGTSYLFNQTVGKIQLPGTMKPCHPEPCTPTHEELIRTSLEAHETLMAMNPENVARFKDVTQFLAEDLRSLEKSD